MSENVEFHCDQCGSGTHDTLVHDDKPVRVECIHMNGCTCIRQAVSP